MMVLAKYPKVLELAKLEGKKGFKFIGQNLNQFFLSNSDRSGMSVSYLGDINGDGLDDFMIGAPGAMAPVFSSFSPGAGQSYVVFGNTSFPQSTTISLSNLDGNNGFIVDGVVVGSRSGFSVSGIGDLNGDGINDIIIGAPGVTNNLAGQSYVIFGKRGVWNNALSLSALDGSNGFVLNGMTLNDLSGYSVSSAGDLNGDGINDLIIGAPASPLSAPTGQSYVVFGKRGIWDSAFSLSILDGSNGFVINGINVGDENGFSVSSIGDVNGDGISDVIVRSAGAAQNYVIFGKRGSWSKKFFLSQLDGSNGFTLNDVPVNNLDGIFVSGAGDVNGDGISDLIIGAPQWGINGAGQSYVVFGQRGVWDNNFSLASLNGSNGFILQGVSEGDISGWSVNTAGDVNGDGISDIIIGAPSFTSNQVGKSYVVFGKREVWDNPFLLSSLDGSNGFTLNGVQMGDDTGFSVGGAGDINGDGISDILIGSPGASPNGLSGAGTTYVITNATNIPPWFVNTTQLTIGQGQFQLFSPQDIHATDDWTLDKNLQFIISNLHYAKFLSSGVSTLTFPQGDITDSKVLVVHDGSDNAPSFDVVVSDGIFTAGPQSARITFIPNITKTNDNTRIAIISGVTGGLAGVGIFGALYLRSRAKRQLEETINALGQGATGLPSDFQRTVLLPIAKAIFEQIKITGFMYYINQATTTAYVQAIEKVVVELQKLGVNFDLQRRGSTADQEKLFKTIAEEIKRQVLPRQGRCSTHPFTRFFCAEVTPEQIQEKAARIASQVQLSLPLMETTGIEHAN